MKIDSLISNPQSNTDLPNTIILPQDDSGAFTDILKDKISNVVPEWVSSNYFYDPEAPRKPNVAELMKRISDSDVPTLYGNTPPSNKDIFHLASDLLYGVLATPTDTRNWEHIMTQDDVLEAIGTATREMYKPNLRTADIYDSQSTLVDQSIQIVSDDNTVLRTLRGSIDSVGQSLKNFGLNRVDENFMNEVRLEYHDPILINFIKSYDNESRYSEYEMVNSL